MSARGMTAAQIADLEDDGKRLIYLVEFAFSTYIRLTSFRKAVTYGGHTYDVGGLLAVSDITENIVPTPGSCTISLNGADASYITQALAEGLVGEQVAIGMFWIDDETEVVSGGVNITVYEVDAVQYHEDAVGGKAEITWSASSVWTDFERQGGRYANDRDQQFHFSGDDFFKLMDDRREFLWGASK